MGKKESKNNEMAIALESVHVAYGKKTVLKDITLSIPKDTLSVIIGPSGAGKSTLLKLMNGLVKPAAGGVYVLGEDIKCCCHLSKLRSKIGYIPQHLGLVEAKTVLENVLMGGLFRTSLFASFFKKFSEKDVTFARKLIKKVGLVGKENERVFHLSGGEKRRVAIARAFMQKPKVLLADEILSDLDFVLVRDIVKQLKDLRETYGTTIVMVEHDIKLVKELGREVIILRNGEYLAQVKSEQLNNKLLCNYFGHETL